MNNFGLRLVSRLSILAVLVFNFLLIGYCYSAYAGSQSTQGPIINDPKLKAEVVFKGLNFPTSMAFLGPNDILVLEKNDGTVRRIVNGTMLPRPLVHIPVANEGERGMLGVAVAKSRNNTGIAKTFVFLYYVKDSNNLITNPNFLHIDNQSGLPTNWNDPSKNCQHLFECTINFTTGSGSSNNNNNNTGFQLSTKTTKKNTWSWIIGKEINVIAGERYEVATRMKLNRYTTQSHLTIEAYNDTHNIWYQLKPQCKLGSNGPLEWREFNCEITIPANTTKIRPVLNAGWSSQPGKQAVTLFDDMRLGLNEFDIHLYRYELVNNKLVNSKSLLNIPLLSPEFNHYGGKILIGPDRDLYIAVGNAGNINATIQNIPSGKIPDGTGGILRITQDGKPVGKGIIGDNYPLNLYYAYGIRNSFGIGFDPVTGKLWDTENDDAFGDEINIVNPGFNSGYYKVQGIWKPEIITPGAREEEARPITLHPEKHLVDFQGKGKYHAPELIWFHTVCPTAITFLNSAKLGEQYKNDMFVGDFNNGNLYHFKLNQNRTALLLSSSLVNKVASNNKDLQKLIFGDGFSAITDVKVGPDGYLYVLRFTDPGTIFRIVPKP